MKYSCDICGQFISTDAMRLGEAKTRLVAVDSAYSIEEHEYICARCLAYEMEQIKKTQKK